MNKNIYEIENLMCQYKTNLNPVLEIDSLKIERGAKVFFIGPSGVGKSTILETLGIMNNTIVANSNIKFRFYGKDENEHGKDIVHLWRQKEKYIARFRKKRLSFIFQDTNLFSSITAYDNISLASTLQGLPRNIAISKSKEKIKKLFNGDEDLSNKPISEISGGQKQRIAFARAIAADYEVLLADEPTGNLDYLNAKNVMDQLVNELNENDNTAIFVTHDIKLAITHATQIVVLKRKIRDKNKQPYGVIDKDSIFIRDSENSHWNHNNEKIENEEVKRRIKENFENKEQNLND